MNTSQISKFLAAVGMCLGFAQAAVAQDSIAAEPVSVWIFSDRYLSSEPVIAEREPLEARVLTRLPVIRLDLCEAFASALLSTAYLFRDFHLEIHLLPSEHSACTVETIARVVRVGGTGHTLTQDEGKAVGRYWAGLMP